MTLGARHLGESAKIANRICSRLSQDQMEIDLKVYIYCCLISSARGRGLLPVGNYYRTRNEWVPGKLADTGLIYICSSQD